MPAKQVVRLGIATTPEIHQRAQDFTAKTGVSQSKLMNAILSVLSVDEVHDIVKRYDELLEIERELRQAADEQFLTYIRGKSVAELKQMLQAVREAGAAVPRS